MAVKQLSIKLKANKIKMGNAFLNEAEMMLLMRHERIIEFIDIDLQ